MVACALLTVAALACVDKAFVAPTGGGGGARLGVVVSLGSLAAESHITAIRIVARYAGPGGPVVLRDLTEPYTTGEARSIGVSLDLSACLREAAAGTAASPSCPVQVTVEVLAGNRVLARDELPVVQVRPGETATTPALAARSATSVRLRYNNSVPPSPLSLVVGGTAPLVAEPLDASGAAIAGRTIVWSSSTPAVASISATGVITALSAGITIITATNGSGAAQVQATATVNVSALVPASVQLSPATANLAVGATQTLTPTVKDAAGVEISPTPTLVWSSSQVTVATVSGTGIVTAVAPGLTTITARSANGIVGSAAIAVFAVPARVLLAPASPNLVVGATQILAPTVSDAGGVIITPTPALTWSTSAAAVATVSQSGLVTAVAPGTATISARTANGIAGTATVTVSTISAIPASVQIAPSSVSLAVAGTQPLVATVLDAAGNTITPTPTLVWQSANPGVATVSTTGVVTAVAAGTTTVTARTANDIVGSATVAVGESGSFSGRVYDFATNTGVAGTTITVNSGGQSVRTVTTDAQGNYNTGTLVGGPFELRATAVGFVPVDYRGAVLNGALSLEAIPLVRTTANGNGTIAGTLFNATTNQPIPVTANLQLFAGVNTVAGTPVGTTTSDASGAYQFTNIPAGTYTIVAPATGFSTGTRTVASVGGGRIASGQNIPLSPTSNVGSLRIVLTWGDFPADLDSHLVGPAANQTTFWVYWATRGSCTSAPFACLDVDALSGRGPETITIAQRTAGRYVYSVHNFSDQSGGLASSGLAQSNARVDVYGASGLLQSFAVPARGGTLWTVFEWDGVTIRPINTVSADAPPARDNASSAREAGSAVIRVKPRR